MGETRERKACTAVVGSAVAVVAPVHRQGKMAARALMAWKTRAARTRATATATARSRPLLGIGLGLVSTGLGPHLACHWHCTGTANVIAPVKLLLPSIQVLPRTRLNPILSTSHNCTRSYQSSSLPGDSWLAGASLSIAALTACCLLSLPT